MTRRNLLMLPLLAHALAGEKRYPPRITGWLHRNDWNKALRTLRDHHDLIIEVSPMWYDTRESGQVTPLQFFPVEDQEIFEIVQNRPLVFRPIITNANSIENPGELALRLLTDSAAKNNLIEQILRVARHPIFNGIDLDLEGIRGANLVHLANFVDELAPRLHDEGKSLAVCIEVQRDSAVLDSWSRIGKSADLVRLMVYSEHTERTEPGPIASLAWGEFYLRRALEMIAPEKLSHGIAVYGRLWGEKNYSAAWDALMQYSNSAEIHRDEENNVPWYRKGQEVVWFEDAESIRTKILLSRSLGIDAFAFWRLGGEDPQIWDMIASL